MGRLFLFCFVVFFSIVGQAGLPTMSLGFEAESSLLIPPAVQAAKSKIFKIRVPYYEVIKAKDYKHFLGSDVSSEMRRRITSCTSEERLHCRVRSGQIEGTAFLDESPRHIWTNCHIVQTWMAAAAEGQVFESSSDVRDFFLSQSVPLSLTTARGVTRYSSKGVSPDKAVIRAFDVQGNKAPFGNSCNGRDDMVKIELEEDLAKQGLIWIKKDFVSAQKIYMGGFPRLTNSRGGFGVKDSDGKRFFWTSGTYLNKRGPNGKRYLSSKDHLDLALAGPYSETHLADGVEGMSGTAVLNEEGKVLGIYKGFVPLSEEQRDVPFVSLFLSTHAMRYLEILSGE